MYDRATTLRAAIRAQAAEVTVLALSRRQVERAGSADAGRNGLVDQGVERRHADRGSIASRSAGSGPMCLLWKDPRVLQSS